MRACWVIVLAWCGVASGQQLPVFDFKDGAAGGQWQKNGHVRELHSTNDGMMVESAGEDPFITGPARDYPADQLLWMHLRVRSEKGGLVQVFYFEDGAREKNSVKSAVRAGEWEDLKLQVPALGQRYRLRIDPPAEGRTTIQRIAFSPRDLLKGPAQWPKPTVPVIPEKPHTLKNGDLELVHGQRLGEFLINVAGQPMAIGGNQPLIGYVHERKQKWIDVNRVAKVEVREHLQQVLHVRAAFKDEDGAEWSIEQDILSRHNELRVHVQVSVTQERAVAYFPIFFLHPGAGSFGEKKAQAIFPGLEYLDRDEPSSSEADIVGTGSQRQVPDLAKITLPLMAVAAEDRYIALMWSPRKDHAAVFDSPDRLYKSGGHTMGIVFPGSSADFRSEGNLIPGDTVAIRPGNPILEKVTVIVGRGKSVIPAVQRCVAIMDLPKLPQTGLDLNGYVKLASAGWLDSQIGKEGEGLYRHAFPGPFRAHPAADAVAHLDWLASRAEEETLRSRLAVARKSALVKIRNGEDFSSAVGHIRTPAPALLFGDPNAAADAAKRQGWEMLKRFEPDGSVKYRPAGTVDYGRTHFAPDANGLTANLVANLLSAATLSGDRELIKEGLRVLRALDKFDHTVPRGAQTWEIPLHTPDILASAHLVRAYVLGFQISGDEAMRERAIYWAWTGVPFVYLRNPTDQPIGPYATIAVLGATNWEAPNWMGMPVQWCGLVYADALYRLAPHDLRGPWKRLADGITASGIQQTWPAGSDEHRQGLLPDAFMPRGQTRVDVCINPATLQMPAARFYQQAPLYSFYVFKDLFVHVPGEVIRRDEDKEALWMRVRGCTKGAYSMLITGFKSRPKVTINGEAPVADAVRYIDEGGRLILKLTGESTVIIE
jgi:hypothetical protein